MVPVIGTRSKRNHTFSLRSGSSIGKFTRHLNSKMAFDASDSLLPGRGVWSRVIVVHRVVAGQTWTLDTAVCEQKVKNGRNQQSFAIYTLDTFDRHATLHRLALPRSKVGKSNKHGFIGPPLQTQHGCKRLTIGILQFEIPPSRPIPTMTNRAIGQSDTVAPFVPNEWFPLRQRNRQTRIGCVQQAIWY